MRLDQYICTLQIPSLKTRGQITRCEVQVLQKDKPLKLSHRIHNSEELLIYWDESKTIDHSKPIAMDLNILYEDQEILILNKEQGLAVHAASSLQEVNLVQGLIFYHKELVGNFAQEIDPLGSSSSSIFRPGIVHRLDKNTSGVLLVAKEPKSLKHLKRQFAEREIQKTYYAIVHGKPEKKAGNIHHALYRDPKRPQYFAVYQNIQNNSHNQKKTDRTVIKLEDESSGIKDAETSYKVLMTWKIQNPTIKNSPLASELQLQTFSLLRLQPKTGRTHQLRVHLKYLGCPIVGDPIYGEKRLDSELQQSVPSLSLMLHAFRLQFIHPKSQSKQVAQVGTPKQFQFFLGYLQRNSIDKKIKNTSKEL